MSRDLTHFDEQGRARMVDIGAKAETERSATARGRVRFSADAFRSIRANGAPKGDILAVAELAGVMGAKKAADLIPLCHPLALTSVRVSASFNDEDAAVDIAATVKSFGRTGVEMEALAAVSIACLTVYDMAKAADKAMTIEGIALAEKTGGASGDYRR